MVEATWEQLRGAARVRGADLDPDTIPDSAGVYAWWRDGEPVYVDCARRLEIRLTRKDTHVAGTWSNRSTLRGRVRLLLREQGALQDSASDESDLVDDWIAGCSVGFVSSSSYEQAQQDVLDLLKDQRPLLHTWRPRYGEDEWLLAYVERLGGRQAAGTIYVEVPVGGVAEHGKGAKTRFIDAVRFPDVESGGIHYYHRQHFEEDLRGRSVEVIEVKKSLSRTVIGQMIVARDLARREWPAHGPLRLVALCTVGDPALEWICKDRGIDLELVPRR